MHSCASWTAVVVAVGIASAPLIIPLVFRGPRHEVPSRTSGASGQQQPRFVFNHILLCVTDRELAVQQFQQLGFTIATLGKHQLTGSHNAMVDLVAAPGGTYIELIGMQPGWYAQLIRLVGSVSDLPYLLSRLLSFLPLERRLVQAAPFMHTGGFCDFAVAPANGDEAALDSVQVSALSHPIPFPQDQTESTGQHMRFELRFPNSHDVPFVCRDVDERHIPSDSLIHDNGSHGVKRIVVLVHNVTVSAQRYVEWYGATSTAAAVEVLHFPLPLSLGLPAGPTTDGGEQMMRHSGERRDLVLGSSAPIAQSSGMTTDQEQVVHITLISSSGSGDDRLDEWLASCLRQRGEVPIMLELWTNKLSATGWLNPRFTFGALIRLVKRKGSAEQRDAETATGAPS